jgi:hypothetical protein
MGGMVVSWGASGVQLRFNEAGALDLTRPMMGADRMMHANLSAEGRGGAAAAAAPP